MASLRIDPNGDGPDELNVLLIDAHALVLRFMAFTFAANGCVVHSASTVDEALAVLASQPVHLVVADVELPGLGGAELLPAVAERQPGVPVVLTSTAAAESTVAALREQAFDYLKQPFSAEDIQRLVARVTEARRRQHRAAPAPLAATTVGVEGLHRIGDAALRGPEMAAFVEETLDHALAGLAGEAALLLLRDEDGHVTVTQKGDRALAAQLVTALTPHLETLYASADCTSLPIADDRQAFAAVAVPVSGPGTATGILCLGRQGAASLDDVASWLPAYARLIGVSLQKILLSESLEANVIDTISSFVVALEAKDVYLKGHSARVSLYVGEIARAMGLPSGQVAMARRAGILHDLGKLVIQDSIYRKPGTLTDEGSLLMRQHPTSGANILKPLRFLVQEAEAIRRHHERYDGGGYPDGLKGDAIPLAARIVAVADAFDDMTSNRPYRTPMPIDAAAQEVLRNAGTQFDPDVTGAFARIPQARLAEIAGFYDTRAESSAEGTFRHSLALVAASKRLFRRKGWSAGHAVDGSRQPRPDLPGLAGAAFRRETRETERPLAAKRLAPSSNDGLLRQPQSRASDDSARA